MGPVCPVCKNRSFKLAKPLAGIQGARFEMPFVVCSMCGAAVAVVYSHDPGVASVKIQSEIKEMLTVLSSLRAMVADMAGDLESLSHEHARVRALLKELNDRHQPTLNLD